MAKKITQISGNSFIVSEFHTLSVEQLVDFSSFQEYYSLSGNYCLIHWLQPTYGEPQWGVYNSQDKTYRLLDEVPLYKPVQVDFLSMPPNTGRATPASCIKLGHTYYDAELKLFIPSA